MIIRFRREKPKFDPGPTPPVNVRIVTRDGDVIPVDCAYQGWNGAAHGWAVLSSRTDIVGLRIDRLPPLTWVGFNTNILDHD